MKPVRKRAVFILPCFGVGGAEKQLANLILHRPDYTKCLEVFTITLLPTTSQYVEHLFETAGAKSILVDRSSMSFPAFFTKLVSEIRHLQPAFVSTFLDSSVSTWGRLAALIGGVPVIVQSDRQLEPEGTRAHRLLRPLLDTRTQRFLPNAHAIADRLIKSGVPRDKITVVPNGVNLELLDPTLSVGMRSALGIEPQEVVLGFLGRFAPVKRIDVLLSALINTPASSRPDRVLLAGDGPTMPAVKSAIEQDEWLREHCTLLGTVDNVPQFLSTIDYLVLPSESEGLPNVILEAMAMGKPTIATRVSDVPLLLGDTGILAEPTEVESLTGALVTMHELGSEGRKELGRKARYRIETEYAAEVASRRFWDAHMELVGRAS